MLSFAILLLSSFMFVFLFVPLLSVWLVVAVFVVIYVGVTSVRC